MFKLIEKYWKPSFTINRESGPYLHRWYLIPKNSYFNIYLHHFLDSDVDTACHDHPWWSIGILLKGNYLEITPENPEGKKFRKFLPKFRSASYYHRIKLYNEYECTDCFVIDGIMSGIYDEDIFMHPRWKGDNICPECKMPGKYLGRTDVWSIFITGPKIKSWGFLCPKGHVNYKDVVLKREKNLHEGINCPE